MPKLIPEIPSGTADTSLRSEAKWLLAAFILSLTGMGAAALLGLGGGGESTRTSGKHYPDNRKPIFEMLLESNPQDSGGGIFDHQNVWDDLKGR